LCAFVGRSIASYQVFFASDLKLDSASSLDGQFLRLEDFVYPLGLVREVDSNKKDKAQEESRRRYELKAFPLSAHGMISS
jgi:hypothetical protein